MTRTGVNNSCSGKVHAFFLIFFIPDKLMVYRYSTKQVDV